VTAVKLPDSSASGCSELDGVGAVRQSPQSTFLCHNHPGYNSPGCILYKFPFTAGMLVALGEMSLQN